jgi:hypothetical protein
MKTNRPQDATVWALRACLKWLEACSELGWQDDDLPKLEVLWWDYHDKEGNRIPKKSQ